MAAGRSRVEGKSVAGLGTVAREPLVRFLAIGVAVFLLSGWLDDTPAAPEGERIVVTPQRVRQLGESFDAVWRRPPTPEELAGLIDDHVREEVYVREALALGLDRDDTVIRRRLRQKMEFLTASMVEMLEPSEAELRAHYDAHQEPFTVTPRLGFEQVFLGEVPAEGEIASVRAALDRGVDPSRLGARTLLPPAMPLSARNAIDGTFGRGTFEALLALPPGRWEGPIASAYGQHLVRVVEVQPAELLPFDAVRSEVADDWRRQRAEEIAEQQFAELRARYTVELPDLPTP